MYNKSIRSLPKYFTNFKNYDNNTRTDMFEEIYLVLLPRYNVYGCAKYVYTV